MFNENEELNKQEKQKLTFSRCNTNNLFWCISSKGIFIANTPIKITVTMLILKTPLKRARRPNRWENGSKRGRLIAPKLAMIVAIMFSAGESAPTRPVCYHSTSSATSFTLENKNDKQEARILQPHPQPTSIPSTKAGLDQWHKSTRRYSSYSPQVMN